MESVHDAVQDVCRMNRDIINSPLAELLLCVTALEIKNPIPIRCERNKNGVSVFGLFSERKAKHRN